VNSDITYLSMCSVCPSVTPASCCRCP